MTEHDDLTDPLGFYRREGDCIVWTGAVNVTGYGRVRRDGRAWLAHRLAYKLAHGHLPTDLCVLHRCDNPPCCNPEHLFLGTRTDNSADMMEKGRHRNGHMPGGKNPNAKLSEDDVVEVRRLLTLGHTHRAIGNRFGVDRSTITAINRGKHWKVTSE